MRIVSLAEIEPIVADEAKVIEAVRQGFIDHSLGKISMPWPLQMNFLETDQSIRGDCHIKCAYSDAYPFFCVKMATGFYNNEMKCLPVNNGMLMLVSSDTGEPIAVLQDRGHLTAARTAAAGALSVELIRGSAPTRLGIIGVGHQAGLQARWISAHANVSSIALWGRNRSSANDLAHRLADLPVDVEAVDTVASLCKLSDVIVTTTPSTKPILLNDMIQPGQGIVALGADSKGKIEIDPMIFIKATNIVTDDHEQCASHGDFGYALRAGHISVSADQSLGDCLSGASKITRSEDNITVVDLTGLGAQDLAIATLVWKNLSDRDAGQQ